MGRTWCQIGDLHQGGVEVGAPAQATDLSGGMRANLRSIDAVEKAVCIGVFAHLQEIIHDVCIVVISEVVKILDVGIVGIGGVGVAAADFVPANMIYGF